MLRLSTWRCFVLLLCLATVISVVGVVPAFAGATLDQVKVRGNLRCGVSEGIPGFSFKDESGRWSGLDVDFCRAVAAATLGSAEKVTFVPLKASARFLALQGQKIDLLARNTTWTYRREAGLKAMFVGVLLYDGQGFMVPAAKGKKAAKALKSLADLKGATVCVEKGSTSEHNLITYSAVKGLDIKPLVIDSAIGVAETFFSGRCQAYTSDASQLAAVQQHAPDGPQSCQILPERISKEPLAPAVLSGDDEWFATVRWVLFALVAAEENGITRANLQERLRDPILQAALADENANGRALGIDPGWSVRVVQSVGNYGEMFERNLGAGSPIRLERGLNRLWTQGGLMYAPPFH